MSNCKATNDAVICNDYIKLAQLRAIMNGEFPTKQKAIEQILKENININYSVPDNQFFAVLQPQFIGYTALNFALEMKDFEVFNQLIKCNADLNMENAEGSTVLHQSMLKICHNKNKFWDLKGKLDNPFAYLILCELIKRHDCTNTYDKHGVSHFHIACMANNVDAVEFFVKRGVPVNQIIETTSNRLPGYTALHLAARYCSAETGKLLLEYGADPQQKNAVGLTPIHILIKRTLELLNVMNVQKDGLSEIFLTEIDDNRKIIRMLLERHSPGVDNFVDDIGLTGLHVLCISNDASAIERLITQKTDLDKRICENSPIWAGYTALHFAAHVNLNLVTILLKFNAGINIQDKNGVTPFDLCIERFTVTDVHFIVTSQSLLQSIQFSNEIILLADFIFSLQSENLFDKLLLRVDKNMTIIPLDSPLWSGYSLLHLAILFCDRIESIDNLRNSEYAHKICNAREHLLRAFKDNCREERHKLYYKRISKILSSCGNLINRTDARQATPLHLAFRLQNRSVLRLLLQHHEQIDDIVDENGVSHFHIACAMKNTKLAKKLLAFGADVNSAMDCSFDFLVSDEHHLEPQVFLSTPGWTPLHLAVVNNNGDLVETLLKHGADIFACDADGLTPVHRVFELTDRYDVGEKVLSASNLEECVTHFGLSFLHVACYVGHEKAVKHLLDLGSNIEAMYNLPENADQSNLDEKLSFFKQFAGLTPLHIAMIKRHFGVTHLLIKRGANIFAESADGRLFLSDILSSELGFSHSFFYNILDVNNTELVQQLAKQIGLTQLHSHCFNPDEYDVMFILKFNGADPNACIYSNSPIWPGKTALHFVAMSIIYSIENESDSVNLKRTVEWLIQYKADINMADGNELTPIHLVAELLYYDDEQSDKPSAKDEQKYRFPSYLVAGQRNFDINPISIVRGISHFDVACACNEVRTVTKFLEHGVDVNRSFGHFDKRYAGFTPLHVAAYHKSTEIVKLLLKHGADVHARDCLGNTPLHVAAELCPRYNNAGSSLVDEKIFEILIGYEAEVDDKNFWGETTLGVFMRSGVMTLRGIEIFVRDNNCRINIFNLKNNKGFLAQVLPRYDSQELITNGYIYKALINEPLKYNCDDMGRTVIHNIVSNNEANISSAEYIAIIEGFINAGFDVDRQDEHGRTALHAAVQFENYDGIQGLLENGADINITDLHNAPAFSFSEEMLETEEENRLNIFVAFLSTILKLNFSGVEVSTANQRVATQLSDRIELNNDHVQNCNVEFNLLRTQKIGESSITWFDLLSYSNKLLKALLFRPHEITDIFEKKIELVRKQFPLFAGLLIMQFRKALVRTQRVEPAKDSLRVIAGLAGEVNLPELCSDFIVEFLDSKDLQNLILSNNVSCKTAK